MDFFRTFFGSFYDPAVYQSLWHARSFRLGYSAIVIAISTLVLTVYAALAMHQLVFASQQGQASMFDTAVREIAEQIPLMTYDRGQLMTKSPEASYIKLSIHHDDLKGSYTLATIDTTGKTTHANMTTPILVSAHEIVVFNESKGEKKIYELTKFDPDSKKSAPLVINHALAMDMAEQLIRYVHGNLASFYLIMGSIMGVVVGLVFYVLRIFMLLALGLIGLIVCSLFRLPITYEAAVRMAAVSYTPVAVIYLVTWMVTLQEPGVLVLLLCGTIMLSAAIVVSRDDTLAATA